VQPNERITSIHRHRSAHQSAAHPALPAVRRRPMAGATAAA